MTDARSSDTMQGRRLPDAEMGVPGPAWDAWNESQPGDYMRVIHPGNKVNPVTWFIRDPTGRVGQIGGKRREIHQVADMLITVEHPPVVEPWTITEHEDGAITVRPSIMDPTAGGWHGWLEHGVWRRAWPPRPPGPR